jgi:Na+-transporting methylmalonyl-CoA/oxaloacetate decarboxylase gamma subunit
MHRLMHRRRDEGSAVVEFVTLGVLLLVPVVYLVVTMGRLQAAAFATDGGARAAAQALASASDVADGRVAAATAARLALLDQGFTAGSDTLTLECSVRACLTPDARVVARVWVEVVLPGVPAGIDAVIPTRITVRSTHVAAVDAFRAAP